MLTCPVHEPARSSLTVLQAAVGPNCVDGNGILSRNKTAWRSAAGALSDWRLKQLREIAAEFDLGGEELTVLRALLHWKDSAADNYCGTGHACASRSTGGTLKNYSKNGGIKYQGGIRDAVTLAFKCGLVS